MAKPPAFQFYAKEWFSDDKRVEMTLAQRGAYIDLLAYQWINDSVPLDTPTLARLLGYSELEIVQIWTGHLPSRFPADDTGRGRNSKLDGQRKAYESYLKACARGGKKAAQVKATKQHGKSTTVSPPKSKATLQSASATTLDIGDTANAVSPGTEKPNGNGKNGHPKTTWLTPFLDTWKAAMGGDFPPARLGNALKPLFEHHGSAQVQQHWSIYVAAHRGKPTVAVPEAFARTFSQWAPSPASTATPGVSAASIRRL